LIKPQNDAKPNREDKTPPSQRFSNKETKIHDEKTAAKIEKNILNLERTISHPNDKSSIRLRPILKKHTRTRKNESPSEESDVVKQYSTVSLRRIKTASESKVVTDLCSANPKECNKTVKSCETTKKNELSDIMTKENCNNNISTSHLHPANKGNDAAATSAKASTAVIENKLYLPRYQLKNELKCYNDVNSDNVYQQTRTSQISFSQPQIRPTPIKSKYITSFNVQSETKTNQQLKKSQVTSMHEKSALTNQSKSLTSHLRSVLKENDPAAASARAFSAAFENKLCQPKSDVRNESKVVRNKNIKKRSECFSESRLPLQSRNRDTFLLNDYENKTVYNYSKPSKCSSGRSYKPSYNSIRRRKYRKTDLSSENLDTVHQFYSERVTLDVDIKNETHDNINELLDDILNNKENRARFATEATTEGSNAVGVKVGKADELDYSVDILINCQQLELSGEPVNFEFEGDDIDSHDKNEVSSIFVDAGKRYFPNEIRLLRPYSNVLYVPEGFKAVYVPRWVNSSFPNCCVKDRNRTLILPYYVLSDFHGFVSDAVHEFDAVSLNRGAKGPAVSLTIQQDDGPNVSVDITPKLTLSNEIISVTDFGWPRRDTYKWLTKEKIDSVKCQQIYLVPKGDKYWKISYANCENELLIDIDNAKTWRKACLRIMKKKLMQWQSKSTTGLKGISSYLLKTTLLWLCEILPEDEYWYKEELANRCLNFLQEFAHRLHKRRIGEYFNPTVNLLENKDDDCIIELKDFIDEEISLFIQ
ncbi:uncharacterized protein LOC132747807, partial [Ruditapes philippinarum]|uniref:uncharacterized protein LOC132747807 n=1 Tax=Ruditapes philippinarum TaxID=129788 RepID=UPI00295B8545